MKDKLQDLLKNLHAELGDAGDLDADAKQKLLVLAAEIEQAVTPDADQSLLEEGRNKFQEAAVSFESEHPRIAGILEGIADTLSKLGI